MLLLLATLALATPPSPPDAPKPPGLTTVGLGVMAGGDALATFSDVFAGLDLRVARVWPNSPVWVAGRAGFAGRFPILGWQAEVGGMVSLGPDNGGYGLALDFIALRDLGPVSPALAPGIALHRFVMLPDKWGDFGAFARVPIPLDGQPVRAEIRLSGLLNLTRERRPRG